MTKILIINTPGLLNRGSMAVLIGALNCLIESMPNAHTTILCHHWKTDREEYKRILNERPVQVRQHPWFRVHDARVSTYLHSGILALSYFFYSILARILTKLGLPVKNVYLEHDVVIDLNTDSLTGEYGIFPPIFVLYNMLLCIIADKPLIVWGTSVLPFRNKLIEYMARFVLNQARLITLREEASRVYLNHIGVNKSRVHVTTDFAFLLKPAPSTRLNQVLQHVDNQRHVRLLIGITPAFNKSIFNFEDYVRLIANLTDAIVEDFGATVMYVPHVLGEPSIWSRSGPLVGTLLVENIFERVHNKAWVLSISGTPLADELKAAIGKCDVYISFMLHPLIASMSSGVPSIAIVTYNSLKFRGVLSMMLQDECIIEVNGANCEELKNLVMAKLNHVLANKELIRERLTERAKVMEEQARLNGILFKMWVTDALDEKERRLGSCN